MVLIRHFSQAAYFLVAIGTFVIVLVTAHNPHQSDLLRRVTRENGIVEWGSVLVLCLIMLTTAQAIWAARKTDHPSKLKRNVLGVLFLTATLSALEEISWGQQIFGFRSSPFFLENNLQRETNLHNLMPASISSSIINTTVYVVFLWMPCLRVIAPQSRPIRALHQRRIDLLVPSFPTMMIFAFGSTLQAYFLFPTWSDSLALVATFVLLSWMLASRPATRWQDWAHLGWVGLCAVTFAAHHEVFRFANMQYEIRELIVVIGCLHWITDWTIPAQKT